MTRPVPGRPTSSPPLRPDAWAPRIAEATARHLEDLAVLPALGSAGDEFTRTVGAAVSGGKRMRGYLAVVGWTLATGTPPPAAPPGPRDDDPLDALAAALELYQASALVHDDVIDHADTRRGRPTTHVALAAYHRARGWAGSPDGFGTAGAILAGDVLLSAADHALARACAHLPPASAAAVMERFTAMHAEVAVGQYLDVRAEQAPLDPAEASSASASAALEVARLKSARYSVVHPAALGALAGGGGAALVRAVEEVLEPWGLAFQLRDDDLGVFGDPAVTGKPAGDDLREGKRTVLLALAWERATPGERGLLAGGLGRRDLGGPAVADLAAVVGRRGRAAHEAAIADFVRQGERALDAAGLEPAQRELLSGLGELLTVRTA